MNWFEKVEDRLDGRGKEALDVLLGTNKGKGEVIYLETPKTNWAPWLIGGLVLLLVLRK